MQRFIVRAGTLAGILLFGLINGAWADLTVGDFSLVASTRISRTVYEYTYTAVVNNGGACAYEGVAAAVSSNSPHTLVVDGHVAFPDVAAGGNAAGGDTFTIRQDRLHAFSWNDLVWDVTGTPVVGPHIVTIGGKVLGGAPMVGTVNIKDSSDLPRYSMSGIGVDGSYSIDIDSEWQPPFLLWAEGYVGTTNMRLLSFIDPPPEPVFHICNVTPATTAVVAGAMGMSEEWIDPLAAPVPSAVNVAAVQAQVQEILTAFFDAFDLPPDFDLMASPLEVGQGADLMFDAVAFGNDGSGNVVLANKNDPATQLVITDETTVEDAAALTDVAARALEIITQCRALYTAVNDLYSEGVPSLAVLQSEVLPLAADGLIQSGSFGAADMVAAWAADPSRGPAVGRTLVSCAIHRPMQAHRYGNGWVMEMPDDDGHAEGQWMLVTHALNGRLFSELTGLVDVGGGQWRSYGDRQPFISAYNARSRSHKYASPIGSVVYEPSLAFWNNDIGNSAWDNLRLTNLAIFHPAMPAEVLDGHEVNCLRMGRGPLRTIYGITNVSAQYGSITYVHRGDGAPGDLDLELLAATRDQEVVIIGLKEDGEPVHAWPSLLGELPPRPEILAAEDGYYFATQLQPTGLEEIEVPGNTLIEWTRPYDETLISAWSKLEWYDRFGNFQEIYSFNPALYGVGDLAAFEEADHFAPEGAYEEGIRRAYSVVMMYDPDRRSEFRGSQEHCPWTPDAIEAREGALHFDVAKAHTDNVWSNQLGARVIATDRAVRRIDADVVVDGVEASGSDTFLRTELRLLYQPDVHWRNSNDQTDLFIVSAGIRYEGGVLSATGYVYGSMNAEGSEWYSAPYVGGTYPFNTPIPLGESNTLTAAYNIENGWLVIGFNSQFSAFDMKGLPAFDPANFKSAEINTTVRGINEPGDAGRMQVHYDNVQLDTEAYDDFNEGLGTNKWWVRVNE